LLILSWRRFIPRERIDLPGPSAEFSRKHDKKLAARYYRFG